MENKQLVGFFVNAETGKYVPVKNRVFNITEEQMLAQRRVGLIKGPDAKPFITSIPREIWEAENQPLPRAIKVEPYAPTPEERMAKARAKLKARQPVPSIASIPGPSPVPAPLPQPRFIEQLVGSPKAFVVFNACKKSKR